ncbi:DUF4843 domain-containing protein [Sphingobacterium sp. LRF_L2]|uniref:DUF4843 domain-containing protein n=1 Tax=Sphingobacterium sp. LRF_L2 TaxID=3369421 RepID=UPI003F627C7A
MKKIFQSILLFVTFGTIFSCAKDERLIYNTDKAYVYFYKNTAGSTADSIYRSFALEPETITKDTFYLNLHVIGLATDYDRKVNLVIDEASTATQGHHFEIGEAIIPANSYNTEVPVILYRTEDLKDSTYQVFLHIGESDDFLPGYDHVVTSTIYSTLEYRFSFTDQLTKPSIWDSFWATYFGTYSETKIRFLNSVLADAYYEARDGVELDWNTRLSSYPQFLNFIWQKAKVELYEYELANGPLIDENGERVTLN